MAKRSRAVARAQNPEAVRRHHEDASWLPALARYAGLDPEDLLDLIGCFHADRQVPALPDWAKDTGSPEYAAQRTALCARHGWSPGMTPCTLAHYELMARESYKLPLHREWLESLASLPRGAGPLRVLDYGCGMGSFAQLALDARAAECTFADVDPEVVAYLRWKHREHAGRVCVLQLTGPSARPANRARIPIDASSIDGTHDAVVLADVLEHLLDPLRVLRQLIRKVRPGGLLFVNYPREIDGDWHTPEAFSLRPWCLLLLRLVARRIRPHSWIVRSGRLPALGLRLADALNARLYARACHFARAHFQAHGEEIAESIRVRAHRDVTEADLLASVIDWPCDARLG